MAVKHTSKPFYGIQFHPESICSELSAKQLILNWWQVAQAWSHKVQSRTIPVFDQVDPFITRTELGSDGAKLGPDINSTISKVSNASSFPTFDSLLEGTPSKFVSATLPLKRLTVPSICEALKLPENDLVVLDSEMRQLPQLGVSSIVGVILLDTKKIQYSIGGTEVFIRSGSTNETVGLENYDGNIFSFLKAFMAGFAIKSHDHRVFCGGLMGYISYEACLETIGIHVPTPSGRPGICFAFVTRSILLDHKRHLVHVQELLDEPDPCEKSHWVNETFQSLKRLSEDSASDSVIRPLRLSNKVSQKMLPEENEYGSKISRCQEAINAGESYELCLTDQTSITLKDDIPAWDIYVHLRRLNPANFGAFVRLDSLTLLSTSLERFLKWSVFQKPDLEQSNGTGCNEQFAVCQFRPMKGTVRKRQRMPDGSLCHVSQEEATKILVAPKEQAENLMILDLIRHDLHSICRDVSVPGLMLVEDYESVYQLVSVIEGKLTKPLCFGQGDGPTGIDCLAASLPPGSMTGAPKKRSCQLLGNIEDKPRSVYS